MIIKIDTIPENAEVHFDEEYIGRTPIDIIDAEPGIHSYTLKYNNKEFSNTLTVVKGKTTHIKFNFNDYSKAENYIDPYPNLNRSTQETDVNRLKNSSQTPKNQNKENNKLERPSTKTPEQVSSISIDNVLTEIRKTNTILETILRGMEEERKPRTSTIYDNDNVIETAVSTDPGDPGSDIYQQEKVNDIIGNNAKLIHVYNYGPGLLYVVSSVNGIDFTKETLLLEGEKKEYTNIHTLGFRSPTALLRYRVTERYVLNQYSQQFTGSRFGDRRDGKGTVIFKDDYESPTLKFATAIVGAGAITRSTDISYEGDFSIKLVTGGVAGNSSTINYQHSDFHQGNIAAQFVFSSATNFTVGIAIHHYIGNTSYQSNATISSNILLS